MEGHMANGSFIESHKDPCAVFGVSSLESDHGDSGLPASAAAGRHSWSSLAGLYG